MPRRQTSRRVPNSKPKLQSIPGALSLYRVGDVIAFDLNGVEFDAPIDSVEIETGGVVLWVTPTVGIDPRNVKRVDRMVRR